MRQSFFILLCMCAIHAHATEIKVLSWNVESNRGNVDSNDPAVIAQQLIPASQGNDRFAAVEILVANNAVANLIRRGEDHRRLT